MSAKLPLATGLAETEDEASPVAMEVLMPTLAAREKRRQAPCPRSGGVKWAGRRVRIGPLRRIQCESVPMDTESGRDEAERRRLQRTAYGPGSTDAQRADALSRLAALRESDRAAAIPESDAPAPMSSSDVSSSPALSTAMATVTDGTDSGVPTPVEGQVDERPPLWRRKPWLVWTGAAAVVAVLAAGALVPRLLPQEPSAIFDQAPRMTADALPEYLAEWITEVADSESQAERLIAATHEVSQGEVRAYVFRDDDTDTYCLAAEGSMDCASPGVFELDGLEVTPLPEADGENNHRVTFDAEAGLRIDAPDPDSADAPEEPAVASFESCVQDQGFVIAVNRAGLVVSAPLSEDSRLEFAFSVRDCRERYPQSLSYFQD